MTQFRVLLSPPDVGDLEQQFVLDAMRSGWVAPAGPDLAAFETEMASRTGVAHAVGLSSGTAALHLALVSWGVGAGDVVPVSTLTFAATVNAIRYVGATPYFIDSESEGGNMSAQLLADALTDLSRQGVHVPVVIPVDLLGKCANYDDLKPIADRFGARLLCDAAESLGASHRGAPAGSFGDASVVSFNGNKVMTTSGGGMLLSNDGDLISHVRKLSTQAREPVAHYEHVEVGYNYRLSNILAALGRAQLRRLDDMIKRRRQWRERYKTLLVRDGVRVMGGEDDTEDNCWLTSIIVDPSATGWTAQQLGGRLVEAGIETRPIWKPMHLQPVSAGLPGQLDGTSERLFQNGLTLPAGSAMSDEDFAYIEDTIEREVARL